MRSLRDWRATELLSQRDLASKAGVTQATVVNIETGRTTPNYQTMRKISEALGVEATNVAEFVEALEKDAA